MLRHPTVIASMIFSLALLVASMAICYSISTLENTIYSKQINIPAAASNSASPRSEPSSVNLPDRLNIYNGNSIFQVELHNDSNHPIYVKEVK